MYSYFYYHQAWQNTLGGGLNSMMSQMSQADIARLMQVGIFEKNKYFTNKCLIPRDCPSHSYAHNFLIEQCCQLQQAQVQAQVQQRNSYSQRPSQMQSQMSNRQTYGSYPSSTLNLGSMSMQQMQSPPPLVRSSQNSAS